MSLMMFILECGPLLGLAGLAAFLGSHLAGNFPTWVGLPLTVGVFTLLVILQIFKMAHRWNLILLLGFAMTAGMLLQVIGIKKHWFPWVVLFFATVVSLFWAFRLGIRLGWIGTALFPVSVAYLLGWAAFYFFSPPAILDVIWAGVGLIVFLGLAVHAITEGRYAEQAGSLVPLASDLFLIFLNLFWLGVIISTG